MNELFKQITQGVYVVVVSDGEHSSAFTAAWIMQVSFKPPLLAIAINPENYSYTLLKKTGICTLNVLSENQLAIAEHFGKPHKDKMAGFNWQQGKTFVPFLAESLAYFDCEVSDYVKAGDHTIAICNVLDGKILQQSNKPLLYSQTGDMDGSKALY